MIIDDKIRDEKLQYDINREAAKILALSSEKLVLTGEEIPSLDQRRVIEPAKFAHSPLGNAFENQKHKQSKQMLLGIKTKDQQLEPIKMSMKIIIKKYLKNQLNKDLMEQRN